MPRIRTIKPEFFTHADLFDAEKETGLPLRIAYAGLWCCADRAGIFRWKPRELKLHILPYDDVDMARVLDALTTRGFLVHYAWRGTEYGCIPTFSIHQVINNREKSSEMPSPDEPGVELISTRAPRVNDACPTPLVQDQGEGKGREGKGRELEGNGIARERNFDTISRVQTRMEFDGNFWPLCPHQTGKTDAYAAFHEARQSASLSDICDGMRRYAETLKRPKAPQPMNPANWLQKQRWTDKPMEPTSATDNIDILTLRGAAGWAAAGAITRGSFDQPPPTRPGFGGDYGGAVEATVIDCDAHDAGRP